MKYLTMLKPGSLIFKVNGQVCWHRQAEPRIIWVQMATWPFIENGKKWVFPHTKKFNDTLEDTVLKKRHNHIMKIKLPDDKSLFDRSGNLSTDGKILYWKDFLKQLKSFDKGECQLRPSDNHKNDTTRNPRRADSKPKWKDHDHSSSTRPTATAMSTHNEYHTEYNNQPYNYTQQNARSFTDYPNREYSVQGDYYNGTYNNYTGY